MCQTTLNHLAVLSLSGDVLTRVFQHRSRTQATTTSADTAAQDKPPKAAKRRPCSTRTHDNIALLLSCFPLVHASFLLSPCAWTLLAFPSCVDPSCFPLVRGPFLLSSRAWTLVAFFSRMDPSCFPLVHNFAACKKPTAQVARCLFKVVLLGESTDLTWAGQCACYLATSGPGTVPRHW